MESTKTPVHLPTLDALSYRWDGHQWGRTQLSKKLGIPSFAPSRTAAVSMYFFYQEDSPDEGGTETAGDADPILSAHSTVAGVSPQVGPVDLLLYDGEFSINSCGHFMQADLLVRRFSLRELYQQRCEQLGISKPSKLVMEQLSPERGATHAASVHNLHLGFIYLGSQGLLAVASIVALCSGLTGIILEGVGLQPQSQASSAILLSLRSCPLLQLIDVSNNDLDDVLGQQLIGTVAACQKVCRVGRRNAGLIAPIESKLQHILDQREGHPKLPQVIHGHSMNN